jgi:FeS assembly SUF system regulator
MLRMTKLADYGVVLLAYMAGVDDSVPLAAKDLAARSHVPLPMVTKILKILAREGLLLSHRGTKGGYSLARAPEAVSMADIIRAVEGPIAVTQCISGPPGDCENENVCPVRGHVRRINHAIHKALDSVTLADLATPAAQQPLHQIVSLDSLGRAASS